MTLPARSLRRHRRAASRVLRTLGLLVLAATLLVPAQGRAQEGESGEEQADENPVRVRNVSELSYLVSAGNSAASTLGVRNAFRRDAPRGDFRLDGSLLRTDATRVQRRAVGTTEAFVVHQEEERERTAERYSAEIRYDLNLGSRPYATGSVGWQRNTFAGYRDRTVVALGAGNRWGAEDRWEVKLGGALTYTFQTDVDPEPDREARFGGVRVTLDHERQVTSGTAMELKWVVDANAEDTRDIRANLTQAVAASLTTRLSLKTTLQFLVDNDPPFTRIPLEAPDGTPTGETVRVPLQKVDRLLSVALVITL